MICCLKAEDPRVLGSLAQVERHLIHGGFLHRYAKPDDFGPPEVAFNVCTFWSIDALAAVGRREEARALFETMLAARNSFGLLSADLRSEERRVGTDGVSTCSSRLSPDHTNKKNISHILS